MDSIEAANRERRALLLNRRLRRVEPISPQPMLSSQSLGWRGYLLEEHSVRLEGTREVMVLKDLVILQLRNTNTIEYKDQSGFLLKQVRPGSVSIRPARANVTVRSTEQIDFLALSFEAGFLAMACGEFEHPERLELTIQHAIEDQLVEGILQSLRREVMTAGASGRLYSDSLANSLALHLVARYGSQGKPLEKDWPQGGPAMVRQAMNFMQDKLRDDLSLRDIAAAVGLSPFHFARRFKESVGLSPYQFLLHQRMERARQLLMQGTLSIAAVATDVGFYDQSHFAQHFKRFHGMTPRRFAEQYRERKPAP